MQLGSYHLSKLRTEMLAVKFVSPPLILRSKFSYRVGTGHFSATPAKAV
jgi:hypothetical protein